MYPRPGFYCYHCVAGRLFEVILTFAIITFEHMRPLQEQMHAQDPDMRLAALMAQMEQQTQLMIDTNTAAAASAAQAEALRLAQVQDQHEQTRRDNAAVQAAARKANIAAANRKEATAALEAAARIAAESAAVASVAESAPRRNVPDTGVDGRVRGGAQR